MSSFFIFGAPKDQWLVTLSSGRRKHKKPERHHGTLSCSVAINNLRVHFSGISTSSGSKTLETAKHTFCHCSTPVILGERQIRLAHLQLHQLSVFVLFVQTDRECLHYRLELKRDKIFFVAADQIMLLLYTTNDSSTPW